MCFLNCKSPDSGFGWAVPHSGPPTEPKRMAWEDAALARTAGVTGMPWAFMEQPPASSFVRAKIGVFEEVLEERWVSMRERTLRASVITSGPAWSPGRTRIW